MNPRYLNYCRVHGRTPEQQHEHDYEKWPGGINTGFILWMSQQTCSFWKEHPKAFLNPARASSEIADHAAWDKWLDQTNQKLDETF